MAYIHSSVVLASEGLTKTNPHTKNGVRYMDREAKCKSSYAISEIVGRSLNVTFHGKDNSKYKFSVLTGIFYKINNKMLVIKTRT